MKKLRLALVGASGRMGQEVLKSLEASKSYDLVWHGSTRHQADISTLLKSKAQIIIDFSKPASTLKWAEAFKGKKQKAPVALICSTGFSSTQLAKLKKALVGSRYALVPNTSLGVLSLKKALDATLSTLDKRYKVEVIESHHIHKVDAPSGTAKQLLECAQNQAKAKKIAVNCHSIRAGSDPGTHTIKIWGPHEQIELSHRAESRQLFAEGALHLAQKLVQTRKKGPFFGIDDFL